MAEHLIKLQTYIAEVDAPNTVTTDTKDMKVLSALLLSLLRADDTLKYDNHLGRVIKASHKSFLERTSHNVSTMIASECTTKISNEKPMTQERILRKLMNGDRRTSSITMEGHSIMMNAQETWLLSTVEVTRRQLVAHGIAISNLRERRRHECDSTDGYPANLCRFRQKRRIYIVQAAVDSAS